MTQYDITFELDNGKSYGFMLARDKDGGKAWDPKREWWAPPSMIKQRINIVITAREDEMSASAVRQLKRIEEILADLETIMAYTGKKVLVGLDKLRYPIRIDKSGLQISTIIHEKGREPEYQVAILCWGLKT